MNVGKQEKNRAKRDEKGRWLPGESGNPEGRRPGTKNLTTKVREALEKIAEGEGKDTTYEELLVKRILKKAIVDGDQQMIKLIWNYLDGMPPQTMDLNVPGIAKELQETKEQLKELLNDTGGKNKQS